MDFTRSKHRKSSRKPAKETDDGMDFKCIGLVESPTLDHEESVHNEDKESIFHAIIASYEPTEMVVAPQPPQVGKRLVKDNPKAKVVNHSRPSRKTTAVAETPSYESNTILAPILVPERKSSAQFNTQQLLEGTPRQAGKVPRKRASAFALSSADDTVYDFLAKEPPAVPLIIGKKSLEMHKPPEEPESPVVSKTRRKKSFISFSSAKKDQSKTSTDKKENKKHKKEKPKKPSPDDHRTAQEKFRAEVKALNGNTTAYGAYRFDRPIEELPAYRHGFDSQSVQQRAVTTGNFSNPKMTDSSSSPIAQSPQSSGSPSSAQKHVKFGMDSGTKPARNRSKSLGSQAVGGYHASFKDENPGRMGGNSTNDFHYASPLLQRTRNSYFDEKRLIESRLSGSTNVSFDSYSGYPQSNVSSATAQAIKDVTAKRYHPPGRRYRVLPEDARNEGVRINIIPQVAEIDINHTQSIWVAVEAEGILESKVTSRKSPENKLDGIDVMVVIDTSSFTSQNTFDSSCELATGISRFLNEDHDRLGIMTSSGDNGHEPNLLLPLQHSVDWAMVQDATASYRLPIHNSRPLDSDLDKAIEAAVEMLDDNINVDCYTWQREKLGTWYIRFHLILLTAYPRGIALDVKKCRKVEVHIVHPGYVPWAAGFNNFSEGTSEGWQLRSMYRQNCQTTALYFEPDGLPRRIERALDHANDRITPGTVRDLEIRLGTTPNTEIEAVLGDWSIPALRRGQVATLFVKLKVGKAPRDTSDPFRMSLLDGSTGLLEELEAAVGEAFVELMGVQVSFHNDTFSQDRWQYNTDFLRVKQVRSDCDIHPAFRKPRNEPSSINSQSENEEASDEVMKRMVFWLAGRHKPAEAMKEIVAIFGMGEGMSPLDRFLKQVLTELAFQRALDQRWGLAPPGPYSASAARLDSCQDQDIPRPPENTTDWPLPPQGLGLGTPSRDPVARNSSGASPRDRHASNWGLDENTTPRGLVSDNIGGSGSSGGSGSHNHKSPRDIRLRRSEIQERIMYPDMSVAPLRLTPHGPNIPNTPTTSSRERKKQVESRGTQTSFFQSQDEDPDSII